jgi:hypothetical protein
LAFPPEEFSNVLGPNLDNPFPLGVLTFWGAHSTWGHDEVNDIVNNSGGLYPNAFWLSLEGFNIRTLGVKEPSIPSINFPGFTAISRGPAFETDNPDTPQLIRFTYDVLITSDALSAFPATDATPGLVTSSFTIGRNTIPAETVFSFAAKGSPYFVNVLPTPNPANENAPWLSADLRVFTASPGYAESSGDLNYKPVNVPLAPTFTTETNQAAFDYISSLVPWLNTQYGNPSGIDPFDVTRPKRRFHWCVISYSHSAFSR